MPTDTAVLPSVTDSTVGGVTTVIISLDLDNG